MANRVLLGNLGSTFGLKVSKEGQNVLTTSDKNLIFDSTKPRTGQVYAGGSNSGQSSAITWTSGSKPTLTYIPIYLIFEEGAKVVHETYVTQGYNQDDTVTMVNNQAAGWELTNTSLAPRTTDDNGWITHNEVNVNNTYPYLSDTSFALFSSSRTSGATKFIILRIPCGFGFMGSTYLSTSGSVTSLDNHPSLGNTETLWS